MFAVDPLGQIELADDPGPAGLDLEIDLPVDAIPLLIDAGMMVTPTPAVPPDALAVHTREAGPQLGPQLSILYCPPVLQP